METDATTNRGGLTDHFTLKSLFGGTGVVTALGYSLLSHFLTPYSIHIHTWPHTPHTSARHATLWLDPAISRESRRQTRVP